jgi:hypothetical protein
LSNLILPTCPLTLTPYTLDSIITSYNTLISTSYSLLTSISCTSCKLKNYNSYFNGTTTNGGYDGSSINFVNWSSSISCLIFSIHVRSTMEYWTLLIERATFTRSLGFFYYPNSLFFCEMGQSILICNLHGLDKKWLVDLNIFSEIFFSCFG